MISCPSKHWNWETEISACLKFYSMGLNPNPFMRCYNVSKKIEKFVKQISGYLLRKMSFYDIKYNRIFICKWGL